MNHMRIRSIQTWLGGLMVGCLILAARAQSPAAAPAPAPAAKAQRILILGDSLMKGLSLPLESELAKQPGITTHSCAEIGTGLARLDLYNWHQEIAEQLKAFKPDTAVVWMGGNDNQPLKTAGGVIQPGTPEWSTEYARRVGLAMDTLIGGGVQRIYWMELPDMRDDKFQAEIAIMRDIQEKEAKPRSQVSLVAVRTLLSPTPGKYRKYVFSENGMPLDIRADDGIHLNRAGYKYLATKIAPTLVR